MQYQNVCVEAFSYTLPDEIVTSEELESRLAPLYRRLRLPEGRPSPCRGPSPSTGQRRGSSAGASGRVRP